MSKPLLTELSEYYNSEPHSLTLLEYEYDESAPSNVQSSRALPESISWKVSRSWALISSNLEKVGVDFFVRE